jgi:hypothetical protein
MVSYEVCVSREFQKYVLVDAMCPCYYKIIQGDNNDECVP